jgi:hypothetical protein
VPTADCIWVENEEVTESMSLVSTVNHRDRHFSVDEAPLGAQMSTGGGPL